MEALEARVQLDRDIAQSCPETLLWNAAFEAAYRSGIGNSPLSCATSSKVSKDAIMGFFASAMKRPGHLVGFDGVDWRDASFLIKSHFVAPLPRLERPVNAANYYGGERRIAHSGDLNHVFVGFGVCGAINRAEANIARILCAMVGGEASVHYGQEMSHLPGVSKVLSEMNDLQIIGGYEECSQGGLLGIQLVLPRSVAARPIIEVLCKELRNIVINTPSTEVLVAAKMRAASKLAWQSESRIGLANALAMRLYTHTNIPYSLVDDIKELSRVTTSDFKMTASKILSRKPVLISLGNLHELPHADEVSFNQ